MLLVFAKIAEIFLDMTDDEFLEFKCILACVEVCLANKAIYILIGSQLGIIHPLVSQASLIFIVFNIFNYILYIL